MGAFQAVGYVCAMGVAEGLREAGIAFAGIGWPQDVVDVRTHRSLCTLRMRAGYDKGMFATCAVVAARQVGLLRDLPDELLADVLVAGIERRVSAWEGRIVAGDGAGGPLAPVLAEYVDLVPLLGSPVVVTYPNGNEMARALCGWTSGGVRRWWPMTAGSWSSLPSRQASGLRRGRPRAVPA